MAAITLYSFRTDGQHLITVYRDSDNPAFIDFFTNFLPGPNIPQPPVGSIISKICVGVDQYSYAVQNNPPYANLTIVKNSPYCGYVPPACDIKQVSFKKTDETASGANDGTANMFCTSSYGGIIYYLQPEGSPPTENNTTGYFTGLAPGNYSISAIDSNNCGTDVFFEILASTVVTTHYKYRLKFPSANGEVTWELKLMDMLNNYDSSIYPLDIKGVTDDPVVFKQADQNEDKTTSIISANLTINLWNEGTFTIDEFANNPEQSWYVELWHGTTVFFKGYILPDEIQDLYKDLPYQVTLKATDGLPSLKGNYFGDGSGGKGYSTFQIQQYGQKQWCKLVKQCLDQLGYDYGTFKVVSSLRYNNVYNRDLWLYLTCWADVMYDSSGVPLDTYSALDLLLSGMKLTLFQHEGSFWAVNWNDIYYINNNLKQTEFLKAFYEFAQDFSNTQDTGSDVEQPNQQSIGNDQPLKPVNPDQTINYDKSYNIEEDISFSTLALLFANPSFEIGAVQGLFPPFMQNKNDGFDVDAFFNEDLQTPTWEGAYDGNWELRVFRNNGQVGDSYIQFLTPIVTDQLNKKVNVSVYWRPGFGDNTSNAIPAFLLTFTDSNSVVWCWNTDNVHPKGWIALPTSFFNVSQLVRIKNNTEWTRFQITTDQLPGTGVGTLNFRIGAPLAYDGTNTTTSAHPLNYYVDIDMLEITLQDSQTDISLQTGEKHNETAVTGIPQANLKQINQTLFTYPDNKHVAGNVFYGDNLGNTTVANTWNFALHMNDPLDRLPAAITRAIARNYFYNFKKFEGDIISPIVFFYSIFLLKYFDGKIFAPFSIEGHLRKNIWHLILIQISDDDVQSTYLYTPVYQKSSRSNN